MFTWVGGLFLPLLLRFAILKRPIGKFLAVSLVSIVYFVQFVIATELNPERKSHAPLFIVAWVGYLILRKDSDENQNKNLGVNNDNNVNNGIDQKPQIKLIESIFNKKAINLWIFIISTLLLIISLFMGSEKRGLLSNEDFYAFLRIFIFCASLYLILVKHAKGNLDAMFPFVITGIIYNPFIPFHFDNDFLNAIRLASVVFFGYFGYREYGSLILNKNKILAEYHSMNAPLKLITQVQYPEMKHLFDKIDALAKQKIESN